MEHLDDIGRNPGHAKNLAIVKNMVRKKRYNLSKIMKDITKNRNMGINVARKLFPKNRRKMQSDNKAQAEMMNGKVEENYFTRTKTPQMAWIN